MNSESKKIALTILTAVAIGGLGFFVAVWILGPVFSGQLVVPQSFGVGPVKIQLYGLMLGLAVLGAYGLVTRRKDSYNIPNDQVDTIIFISIISGFIGARLYHVISEYGYYVHQPEQIFAVWNGGLSIFGAAIGAVLALFFYQKYFLKSQVSFLSLLDWLTPGIVIGQIVGRFGNFLNYELYGYPTSLSWKMFVPMQFRMPPYELNEFFHPLFLYEAAGSVVILVLVLKLKPRSGTLFLMWLLLYNVMRFFLEFLRVGSVTYGNIRVNAVMSALMAIVAVVLWYKLKNQANNVLPNPSNN